MVPVQTSVPCSQGNRGDWLMKREVDWSVVQSLFSETAMSCIYTNHIAAKNVPWRKLPDSPGIPNEQMRLMLAQHILEEAMETIEALGCLVDYTPLHEVTGSPVVIHC